jgi:hypothetical protein
MKVANGFVPFRVAEYASVYMLENAYEYAILSWYTQCIGSEATLICSQLAWWRRVNLYTSNQ